MPSLIFLSEPQLFQCDSSSLMKTFQGSYSHHLSSEDLLFPELALEQTKAKGGTMVLWQTSLDPFVSVLPTDSPALAAIVLKIPGICISAHVAIYLPTAGQEVQFVSALASLDNCLVDLLNKHDDLQVFIRGDANVNPKNRPRASLLEHFLSKFSLLKVETGHQTYHHFMGMGTFDSQLDVILHTKSNLCSESLTRIICKLDNPLVQSHHDLILSSFSLATSASEPKNNLVVAPKVDNTRVKIIWSEEGITQYEEIVADNLSRLRDTWCDPTSPASMSVLLHKPQTNLFPCQPQEDPNLAITPALLGSRGISSPNTNLLLHSDLLQIQILRRFQS